MTLVTQSMPAERSEGAVVVMPRLKEYREAAGLSQTELAVASGNNPSYISLLERGLRRNPSAIKALAITRVLSERLGREVTIAEVFGFDTDERGTA